MDSSSYVPSFSMALVQLTTMRGISDPVAMMYWSTSPPKSLGTSPGIELPYASTPTVTGGLQGGREGGSEGFGGTCTTSAKLTLSVPLLGADMVCGETYMA